MRVLENRRKTLHCQSTRARQRSGMTMKTSERLTTPLVCRAGVAASTAGRKTTRIFRSSTAPLAIFSTFCHCKAIRLNPENLIQPSQSP